MKNERKNYQLFIKDLSIIFSKLIKIYLIIILHNCGSLEYLIS